MHLVRYRRHQALLMETPEPLHDWAAPTVEVARSVIAGAAADGRGMLTEPEAEHVLEAYGIPVARTLTAATPEEAGRGAEEIGGRIRSDERRGGKEGGRKCRTRWAPAHYKKKIQKNRHR